MYLRPHVVVVGGGFAGASSASSLAEAGFPVTLLEQKPTLGGRTSSLRDGVTKEEVDNGQHLFMGCYRDTRRFLRRLKVEDRIRFFSGFRVPFVSPGGRRTELKCPPWPGSLGFLTGVTIFKELKILDRLALTRSLIGFRWNGKRGLSDLTVSRWLDRIRQPAGARRAFWTPLCLATLNERPEVACAEALAVVLREGLLGGPAAAALGYSKVSLGKLWSVELSAYLKRQGGVVSSRQTVTGFEVEGRRVKKVRLESGESVEADAVVCAVPLPSFLKICPDVLKEHYGRLEKVAYSAIASINLWFSRPVMEDLFMGLLDTKIQWIFNRHRLWEDGGASPGYVSVVLSGASEYVRLSGQELMSLALSELRRCLPSLPPEPVHGNVVWEKQATPSPSPANWKLRPPVETPLENFFLAGDWVDSGLPATIEAACRSGHRAADAARKVLDEAVSSENRPAGAVA